ncbi:MAG TPA: hypothetical protein VH061_12795 [Solirubrobacteraceae bacterium]|jgi:hypothetical protein|nr:hypothetical protein [Solirubrobacteraceae bacterium]
MHGSQSQIEVGSRTRQVGEEGVVIDLRSRTRGEDRPVRCVSSGYMSGGCSCQAAVPATVARSAWARELGRAPAPEGRFFHFTWKSEIWLGFGLADGDVRGVYCPVHRAARDGRAAGCEAQHYARPARLAAGA